MMIMPEMYMRIPERFESEEMRELRLYARSELNSGIGCIIRECGGAKGNGRKRGFPLASRFFMLIR